LELVWHNSERLNVRSATAKSASKLPGHCYTSRSVSFLSVSTTWTSSITTAIEIYQMNLGWTTRELWFDSLHKQTFPSLTICSDSLCSPHPSIQWLSGAFSSRTKAD